MTTTLQQPQVDELDFTVRAAALNLDSVDGNSTVDSGARTVRATVATEARVMVYARDRRQVVEEILVMRGYEAPASNVPLLDNHTRWSLDDVFGSARGLNVEGRSLEATLHFASLLGQMPDDPEARRVERAWLKVEQGHQKQVSLGYDVLQAQYVEPNTTRTIGGRSYTAGDLPLRVATKWRPKEVSLTPIAADQFSSTRSENVMSKRNETGATAPEPAEQNQTPENTTAPAPSDTPSTPPNAAGTSGSHGTLVDASQETNSGGGQRSLTIEDVRADRARVNEINELFSTSGVENDSARSQAINEGWSAERVSHEIILPAIRQRPAPVSNGHGPAVHSHGSHQITNDVLIAAFNARNQVQPDHSIWQNRGLLGCESDVVRNSCMRQDINNEQRQQTMEVADRLGHVSMFDLCRMVLQVNNRQVYSSNEENMRSAMSSGDLLPIFTSNMFTRILASFVESEDTTTGWTTSDDVPNFKQQERITMGKSRGLKKVGRGQTAEHTDIDAKMEPFRIARYGDQFVVDEQDFIDDSFGAINSAMPEDMGRSAAQLRPNLVYSILLANPTLNATGEPLFSANNGNGNLFLTTPLDRANIEKLITAMMDERYRDRPINARLRYLILPPDLFFLADRLVNSVAVAADTEAGTKNTLEGRGITIIGETRIGAGGVTDPDSEVHRPGSTEDWYTSARPGEDNAQTILVAYRSGTNRSPRIRSFMLDRGQWGMGWDINMDIGAKAMNWRFMQKADAS